MVVFSASGSGRKGDQKMLSFSTVDMFKLVFFLFLGNYILSCHTATKYVLGIFHISKFVIRKCMRKK